MIGADGTVTVSFVHGFHDDVAVDYRAPRPALWTIDERGERTHDYVFPAAPGDFGALPYAIAGEGPRPDAACPRRRPRYGFTGLVPVNGGLIAGSWNGFYVLEAGSLAVERFITNRFTCYVHRFHADDEQIVFVMPFMDLVVTMDHAGRVVDRFTVDRALAVSRELPDADADWRFVSKPWSGPTGFFHFNSVQKIDGSIVLMSRNLGAFVVIEPGAERASLRTLNYRTPACVHDGDFVDGRFYLTSIDGKVLIASPAPGHDPRFFHYDLQVESTPLGAVQKNWCRGIAVTGEHIYTTIDGRYDADLSFGLLQLDRACNLLDERRFRWAGVGDEKTIRYVTGFDIVAGVESAAPSRSSQVISSSASVSR